MTDIPRPPIIGTESAFVFSHLFPPSASISCLISPTAMSGAPTDADGGGERKGTGSESRSSDPGEQAPNLGGQDGTEVFRDHLEQRWPQEVQQADHLARGQGAVGGDLQGHFGSGGRKRRSSSTRRLRRSSAPARNCSSGSRRISARSANRGMGRKFITSANPPICKRKGGPSTCTSASWPPGGGRPWSSAGNATRTSTPDAWMDATIEEGIDWKAE
jgi:hypothetical protein